MYISDTPIKNCDTDIEKCLDSKCNYFVYVSDNENNLSDLRNKYKKAIFYEPIEPIETLQERLKQYDVESKLTNHMNEFWINRQNQTTKRHLTTFTTEQEIQEREHVEQFHVHKIFKLLDKKTNIYEPGCGVGRWSLILQKYSSMLYSSDLVHLFVEKSRETLKEFKNVLFSVKTINEMNPPHDNENTLFVAGVFMFVLNIETILSKPWNHIIIVDSILKEQYEDDIMVFYKRSSERAESEYSAIYRKQSWWQEKLKTLNYHINYEYVYKIPGIDRSDRLIIYATK